MRNRFYVFCLTIVAVLSLSHAARAEGIPNTCQAHCFDSNGSVGLPVGYILVKGEFNAFINLLNNISVNECRAAMRAACRSLDNLGDHCDALQVTGIVLGGGNASSPFHGLAFTQPCPNRNPETAGIVPIQ